MDIGATLFSTGWASGVNAYATVALLGILGRSGVADIPAPITSNLVIGVALVMFAIEFVTDKVAYVDSAWDSVHTLIRPAIGAWLGALLAGHDGAGTSEVVGALGSGSTALASHGVKAGLRILINTMPEPFSNIAVSLTEDGLVATVVGFSVNHPVTRVRDRCDPVAARDPRPRPPLQEADRGDPPDARERPSRLRALVSRRNSSAEERES